ncbi:DUF3048 domain-containing protein [Gracilibacillus marinus]|uniref:DUF3048 domain-containing protein n=1 Tax=Gracilibacillus marinus TaxID=630535 RepID=A0ABV8VWU4_9BACI
MLKKVWIGIIVLLLFCVACQKDEVIEKEEEPKEPVVEVEEEPEQETGFIAPLTGEEVEEEPTDRIIAVMVNNHPKARPQTSLSKADMVFEILAEGNITRYMALFHSDIPETVGPVRSARPYYFNLANDYGALYVYHGAADFIENMIQSGAVDGLNGMYYDNDQVLFQRSTDRVAPHNSYAIFEGIYQRGEEKGYSLEKVYEPFVFTEEEITGDQASEISYNYSNYEVKYVYDESSKKYNRYSDGVQVVEYADSTPVQMSNVLFIEANHEVVDDVGRREIDLESGGNALLLQNGKVQHVQWERIDGRIIPTMNGEPVPFVQGKTWVNVIPTNRGLQHVVIAE